MADVDVVDAGDTDSIYHTIQILVDEDKERRKNHPFPPSIYRVPKTLRNFSLKSYTPYLVSIGPFHEDAQLLKGAEAQKSAYLGQLLRRLQSPSEQTLKACINKVLAKIDQIKACYEGKMKTYDDKAFAKMMVVDACFIIQLISRSSPDDKRESHYLSFFDNDLLTLYLKHDLLLLENQIPFFVLQDMFDCTVRKVDPGASLVNLVISFLKDMNPLPNGKLLCSDEGDSNHHDHILGLFQKCYQHARSKSKTISITDFKDTTSYSVTELALAGVNFKPNKDAEWLLSMEFKTSWPSIFCWSWGKPTFRMPVLQIEEYTESVLRNLIAYEQLRPAVPNYVTSYAFAMERIIDTKEDIVKAIESRVVVNNLGSSEQASNMINSLCKEVTVHDFFYMEQWKQLDGYYNGYWPKNIARLRRTYFNTPWSLIALIAAILLFGLTVAQTYFTIWSP